MSAECEELYAPGDWGYPGKGKKRFGQAAEGQTPARLKPPWGWAENGLRKRGVRRQVTGVVLGVGACHHLVI